MLHVHTQPSSLPTFFPLIPLHNTYTILFIALLSPFLSFHVPFPPSTIAHYIFAYFFPLFTHLTQVFVLMLHNIYIIPFLSPSFPLFPLFPLYTSAFFPCSVLPPPLCPHSSLFLPAGRPHFVSNVWLSTIAAGHAGCARPPTKQMMTHDSICNNNADSQCGRR